ENLVRAIDGSRTRGLARLLNALGIRLVGERVAQLLAARFGSLERLAQAPEAELAEVHGVGEAIARSVRAFFDDPTNSALIKRLKEVGVEEGDRKSTRLNSSHDQISYAVFCLKKKNKTC